MATDAEIRKRRIEYLKLCKHEANGLLSIYKDAQNLPGYKKWEKQSITFCIKKLKGIIKTINAGLRNVRINEFVEGTHGMQRVIEGNSMLYDSPNELLLTVNENFDLLIRIIRLSPSYNIVYDLNWIEDGSIGEHRDIALGIKPISILSDNYLSYQREAVKKEVNEFISSNEQYKSSSEILYSAINMSFKKEYLASTILLLTCIEGLVRLLAKFILTHQNNNYTESEIEEIVYYKHHSLEGLLYCEDIYYDLPVTYYELKILGEYIDDSSINDHISRIERHIETSRKFRTLRSKFFKALSDTPPEDWLESDFQLFLRGHQKSINELSPNDLIDIQEKFFISFRVKLYYLSRRVKELRNQLIHGNYSVFSDEYHNYISFAAIGKVIQLQKEYIEIYKN